MTKRFTVTHSSDMFFALAAAVLVLAVATGCRSNRQTIERLAAYRGLKLDSSTIICRSSDWAAGGFWRDQRSGSVEQGVMVGSQPQESTWRITVKGEVADVIRFSGTGGTIEQPETFRVERTQTGLLLVSQRVIGESPQIITIDPGDSSFVYSSQHVNMLWNRASIFYGSCQPYM